MTNQGAGFFALLTLLFVGLKLSGHIDWPWWLVLSPMLAPLSLVFAMALVVVIVQAANKHG